MNDTLVSVGLDADDPKAGMTLDDVARFVEHAYAAGHPGGARVGAKVGWRQQLESLEVRPGEPAEVRPARLATVTRPYREPALTITVEASDARAGLTLTELAEFAAHALGGPVRQQGSARVLAELGWRLQLVKLRT